MWVTSSPLGVEEATLALQKAVPNLDELIKKDQIEIISYDNWYLIEGKFDSDRVLAGWAEKEKAALARGFEGLRLTGNTFWVERELWNSFVDYEEAINKVIGQHRMLALCTYCLKNCKGTDVIDVVRNHVGTLIKQGEKWSLVEDSLRRKKADAEIARLASFPAMNPNPVIEVDTDGNLKYANAAALTTFPNIQKAPLLHPFFSGWEDILKSVRAEKGGTFSREHKVGDHWYYQQFYLVPRSQSVRSYTIQIDSVKQTEKLLRESEERWATTISSIGDAVIATDVKGNITFLNSVAEKITGWQMQDAEQKPLKHVFNIINEFTRKEVESPVDRVIREGLVIGLANHTILVRKDGTEVPIDDSGAPIKDKEGTITGVVLVFRDITERKKAEESLRESELKFRTAANFTHDWEYWIAPNGNFVYISPSCENLTGYSPDEFVKNPKLLTKIIHPEDKVHLEPHFDLLNTNDPHQVDFRIITRSGDCRWVSHACQPVFDDEGKWLGRRASNRDITERRNAEEALKENEKLLNRSQEIGHLGSWELDLINDKLTWSDEVYRIFGLQPQEFAATYEAFLDAVHPDDRVAVDAAYLRSIKEGKDTYAIEHRVVRKSTGEVRIVQEKCEHTRDKAGKIIRSVGMVQDITEYKKAESELQQTSVYLENLLNYANAPIIVWDHKFHITLFNHAFERLTGLNAKDTIEKPLEILFPEGRKKEAMAHIKRALEGEYWETVEIPIRVVKGNVRTILWNSANIYDSTGKEVISTIAQGHDITERKQAEQALHRAKVDWERTFNSVPDLIAILDNQYKIVRANRAMSEALGTTPEQCIGLKCFRCVHRKDKPPDFCPHSKALIDGQEHTAEVHEDTLGGDFLVSDSPLKDDKGRMIGSVHVARNITERKQMEKKLEEYSRHLERLVAERTKQLRDSERLATIGATAGMVGHDIRNPLQAITCDLYLAGTELESCPDNKCKTSMKESLLGIEKNIEYINKIVADLQDFSRPLKPNVSETNLEHIINEALNNFSVPENITVKTHIVKDVQTVMADASYVKRILSNLVNNAVQAMPSGGTLVVEAYDERNAVTLTVADTGVGIPEEVKEKLFTPLFTTKSKGQGFGLAVVKRMAEALDGTVTFESQTEKGTKFIVRLPKKTKGQLPTA